MGMVQASSHARTVLAEFKGAFWYPEHTGEKKRVKGREVVNVEMAQGIACKKFFRAIIPIGSVIFIIL